MTRPWLSTVLLVATISLAFIAPPASASDGDFRLTDGRSTATIPFELYMNLVLIQVRVNGTRTLWFNLDSGLQTTILDSNAAKQLGLTLQEKTEVQVPGGTLELAFADGVSMEMPGVAMINQRVRTLPLAVFTPVLGRPIQGTIGHDLFNRFVVEIDYDARLLRLYEPQTYRYTGKGESVPVLIENEEVFIEADILQRGRAPIPAKLKLDTGSASELGLNGSFVKAVNLVRPGQRVVPQPGVALGGITENFVTRIDALRIGKIVLKKPVAGYSKDLSRGGDAGTLGGEIFRRFTAIFDYSRKRMILEKNDQFREPYRYDTSGMFLSAGTADLKTVKVLRAVPNAPAHEAGIRDDDEITAIDGRATSSFTLEGIRKLLMVPGRTVRLTIHRQGKAMEVPIRLRNLI